MEFLGSLVKGALMLTQPAEAQRGDFKVMWMQKTVHVWPWLVSLSG